MMLRRISASRKRVLKKELKELKRTYEPELDALRREGKVGTEAYENLVGEFLAMRAPVDRELWAVESHDLRHRALRSAVPVPPFA